MERKRILGMGCVTNYSAVPSHDEGGAFLKVGGGTKVNNPVQGLEKQQEEEVESVYVCTCFSIHKEEENKNILIKKGGAVITSS
jgi:hypothetical protein